MRSDLARELLVTGVGSRRGYLATVSAIVLDSLLSFPRGIEIMSNEVIIREETRAAVEVDQQEMLAQVVDSVRRDSQQSAVAFLTESAVPHGGE